MRTDHTSITVEENLKAMRAARESYVKAESSDRIKRALRHNVRTSCESNFLNGERVYFKRDKMRQWHGPAKVIGQDGKQVILRYDSQVVRVHVSRITRVSDAVPCDQDDNRHDTEIHSITTDSAHNMLFQGSLEILEEDVEEIQIAPENDIPHDVDGGYDDKIPQTQQPILGNIQDDSSNVSTVNPVISEHVDNPVNDEAGQDEDVPLSVIQPRTREESSITAGRSNGQQSEDITITKVLPNIKSNIIYKLKPEDEWKHGFVHSRAGKACGRNNSRFNIQDDVTKEMVQLQFTKRYNFEKDIIWEPVPSEILITNVDEKSLHIAKLRELENWKDNKAYEEVDRADQKLISTRWVVTTKEKDGAVITKARLCARGYEDLEVDKKNTNSPTCSKETIRVTLAILAAYGWSCKSLDVKSAFLQGKPIE